MSEASRVKLVAMVFAVFVANYFSATWFGYPFAYCWGDALLSPLLAPLASLSLFFAGLSLMYVIGAGKGFGAAVQVVFAMLLIAGLPHFADTLFRLGASCR